MDKRLTAQQAVAMFEKSGKKHFLITGDRQVGKTTLFNQIIEMYAGENGVLPGLTSRMIPGKYVILQENGTENWGKIGVYCPEKATIGKTMIPDSDGFITVGIPVLKKAMACAGQWVSIDELGFLEIRDEAFLQMVLQLFEEKRVIAVIRKQKNVEFLERMISREDAFVLDLDAYYEKD